MSTFSSADTSHLNGTKNGTDLETKSGTEVQFTSSAEPDSPPGNSSKKPQRAGDVTVLLY
jgi:hypothetical protein